MTSLNVLATLALNDSQLALVRRRLQGVAEVLHLPSIADSSRTSALQASDAVLARNTGKELRPGEAQMLSHVRLVQFVNAGLDFVPLHEFDADVPIAGNKGAYAGPIAEHAMAMYLAASKRLLIRHEHMRRSGFGQFPPNQAVAGKTCGILGLGGIGSAIAHLARAFGMHVFGITRRGVPSGVADRVGTLDDLEVMLRMSDVLMICMPLTSRTEGLIGARELQLMKPDATLVNVARGEIVDETALFERLVAFPEFTACIDAWWVEPVRHGAFRLKHPILELPNVIGSPHNSASVPDSFESALLRAVDNVRQVLLGGTPRNLLPTDERAMTAARGQS